MQMDLEPSKMGLTDYRIEGNFGGGKVGELQAKFHLAK